jgi:3-deoxy-D-manno-octulosonic acid kinase
MLYDASCIGQPREDVFDPPYWRARGALEESAGGRGTIAFIREGEQRWVLRHYRRGGLVARVFDDTYLWTGAERTLICRMAAAVAFARVAAAVRSDRGALAKSGLVYRADLITEELPTRDARAGVAFVSLDAALWRATGRCIARLHARGVHHADLNAHNLLLARGERLRARFRPRPHPRAWRGSSSARAPATVAQESHDRAASRTLRRHRLAVLPAGLRGDMMRILYVLLTYLLAPVVIAMEGWKALWNPGTRPAVAATRHRP